MRKILLSNGAGVACVAALAVADAHAADELQFNRDIRPILSENCFQCHGPDAAARQADLRLDDAAAARHVLEAGDSGQSELVRRILTTDPAERMPPADSGKTLTDEQKKLLARWVSEGASFQPHWAFIPPVRPALPEVKRAGWARGAIDQFVLRRLEDARLSPSPEADRATLLRRVTLDLTGLPPTPQEVAEFLADKSDAAYERQVDRLLASPRYGEHMAAVLARSIPLRRHGRLSKRSLSLSARVARLGDPGVQRKQAVRRVRRRAVGRRHAAGQRRSSSKSRRDLAATIGSTRRTDRFRPSGKSSMSSTASIRWGRSSWD